MNCNIYNYSMPIIGLALSLSHTSVSAGTMGPIDYCPTIKHVYAGIFGGGGSSNSTHVGQFGTAFFSEEEGGPLSVNAVGSLSGRDVGLIGGHLGYEWPSGFSNDHSAWTWSPAIELEGYYLGGSEFIGEPIINPTDRLPAHEFRVTLPMQTGVFLVNGVLNIKPAQSNWKPYVGAGIGAAVISIHNADSTQIKPLEAGNHFNSNPNDSASAFASQAKAGLKYDFSPHLNFFVEYRGLFIADTSYIFGPRITPNHAATSSWLVDLGSQYYNAGVIGVEYRV